jgi:hypothetical protein
MKEFTEILKEIKKDDFDFLTFLSGDKKGQIDIMTTDYNDPGESVGGNSMGKEYHIVLFRDHKTDPEKYDDLDVFEAILLDPIEYVSRLIPAGFYGIIGRKTTTSDKIIQKLVANFNES